MTIAAKTILVTGAYRGIGQALAEEALNRGASGPRDWGIGLWQQFVTVAGMVTMITAVLAGSAGGLLAAVVSGHSLVAALVAGVVVAAAALTGLMRYQNSAWIRGSTASLFPGAEAGPH